MSSYLDIASVSEVISAGSRLRTRADALESEMSAALAAVRALDTDASFPRDEFTEAFLKEYHQPPPDGEGGFRFNDEVDELAGQLGKVLQEMGQRAVTAMGAYAVTDDDNAGGINAAAGGSA